MKRKALALNPGDSRERVVEVMGAPQDRQFNGNEEALQWCETGSSSDLYTVVWLTDNKVTTVSNYTRRDHFGSCTNSFKQINWSSSPDTTIEIRER